MYTVWHPLSRDVLFCYLSEVSGYQLGCTVAAVSAERPVKHDKNAVQNITIEWKPHSVYPRLPCEPSRSVACQHWRGTQAQETTIIVQIFFQNLSKCT